MREFFAGFLSLSALALPAFAAPLPCAPEGASPITLTQIDPDGTLTTLEGRRLRLAGLIWPDALEPARQASLRQALEKALAGERISIKPAAPPDRWGIESVHVFVAEKEGEAQPFWLQAGLVEAGLAPAWPEIPGTCWRTLLHHEGAARRARRGYWAPRAQAARHAAIRQAPARHAGRRMAARWRVSGVRKSEVMTYVNIAPFFRVGPSIALSPKEVKDLALAGRDPMQLAGKVILTRFISGSAGLLRVRLAPGEALVVDDE
jgi:hypothetical protein